MASRLATRGMTVAYDDVGRGDQVVVLVHGHPFNRSMWAPQLEALAAAGWRAVVPDLRGYGESSVTPGIVPLEVFADDIAALLDHLGVARAVVAGLSMGGQIAMAFAERHPARLRGLVLAATFPQAETAEGRTRRHAMADRLLAEGMDTYADEALPQMIAAGSLARSPALGAHVLGMMRGTDPEGAAAALRGRAARPDYRDMLRRLAVPGLVVVGDEDAFTTRADAEAMATLPSCAGLAWIDGVGHLPNLEAPAIFNRHLTAFLTRVASR
jgi:pimeloyl-ACP methyl ester carboxylesterase